MQRSIKLLIGGILILSGCDNQALQNGDRTLQDILNTNATPVVRHLDASQVKRGEALFIANCENCHGKDAIGTPNWRTPNEDGKFPPPPLNGTAHAWHHSSAILKKTILEGGPPEMSTMPAWKGILTEQQVDDIVVWILSLWPDEIYTTWYQNFEDH